MIRNFVRALRPPYTPGAYFMPDGRRVVVDSCEPIRGSDACAAPGAIVEELPGGRFLVACQDGLIQINTLRDLA